MDLPLTKGTSHFIFNGLAGFFSGIETAFTGTRSAFGTKRKLIGRKNWLTRSRLTHLRHNRIESPGIPAGASIADALLTNCYLR